MSKTSNEGEFLWSWLQWGPHLSFERERKNTSSLVDVLQTKMKLDVAVGQGQQRKKNPDARAELLIFSTTLLLFERLRCRRRRRY